MFNIKNLYPKFKPNLVVSYPKSGRTWLRYMLVFYYCNLNKTNIKLNEFETEPEIQNKMLNSVNYSHLGSNIRFELSYYQFIQKNHLPLNKYNCLFLHRHYLSCMKSAYHHALNRVGVFQGTPTEFVHSNKFGIMKLITFYNIFLNTYKNQFRQIFILSYEDMVKEPEKQLREIILFLGWPLDDKILQKTVFQSSFESMRKKSILREYNGTPIAPVSKENDSSFKIRNNPSQKEQLFDDEDLLFMEKMVENSLDDEDNILKFKGIK